MGENSREFKEIQAVDVPRPVTWLREGLKVSKKQRKRRRLGTAAVAADHYLQMRDQYFADAVRGGEQAAQNAAQPAAETPGNEPKDESGELPEPGDLPSLAAKCSARPNFGPGPGGHELPLKTAVNPQVGEARGAESGAPEASCPKQNGPAADGVVVLLDGRPVELSDSQRAVVLGIVRGERL